MRKLWHLLKRLIVPPAPDPWTARLDAIEAERVETACTQKIAEEAQAIAIKPKPKPRAKPKPKRAAKPKPKGKTP